MPVPPDYMVYGPTEEEMGSMSIERRPLKCSGVGRDKDCVNALQFYFSRCVTDDEMRFLYDVMQCAVACMPSDRQH